jgi:hypothetical protein
VAPLNDTLFELNCAYGPDSHHALEPQSMDP